MRIEYWACFTDGNCIYYGWTHTALIADYICPLDNSIKIHGDFVAKWTVKFKTGY